MYRERRYIVAAGQVCRVVLWEQLEAGVGTFPLASVWRFSDSWSSSS